MIPRGGRIVLMRIAVFQFSFLSLLLLSMPIGAQETDLEGVRPDSPAIGTDNQEQPETGSRQSQDDLDRLIDENPIDLDPLDILDSANPLGKVEGLIDEISRNMKEIERLLDDDDTGEQNQSIQQNTLSRIDELITEVQRLTGT